MTNKGRHASESSGSFYRDLAMMTVGILLVGAAVFLLLFLFAGDTDPEAGATSTTAATGSSTTPTSVATTAPPTTTPTTTPPTSNGTVPLRAPGEVRVMVLNSLQLSGAAGRFTQDLADAGYQTLPADDYDPELDPSRIWYRDGFSAEANVLLEMLPGALVEPLPDPDLAPGSDVVVVLGVGYEE
jgi:LytR cell envelope-related transcriptional attenuator